MKDFEYFRPETQEEACSLLSQFGAEAKLLAGGTEIIVKMKQMVEKPRYIVDLKKLSALNCIDYDKNGALKVGAVVTLKMLETSAIVREKFSILAQAAGKVGSPQLRNRGTIGGNICLDSRCLFFNQSYLWKKSIPLCFKAGGDVCHVAKGGKRCFAVCSADTVPALIALGAKIKLLSSKSERIVSLEDFYLRDGDGMKINVIRQDEVLSQLEIPVLFADGGGAYLKISQRKAFDFPIASVAIWIRLGDTSKVCRDISIVVGAVSSHPIRACEAEEVLRGKEITDDLVRKSSLLALNAIRPISNAGGFAKYRKQSIPVLIERAICQATEAARSFKGGAGI